MQAKKLRRLSASSTGNAVSAKRLDKTPELLNSVGSDVCFAYLQEHPGIARVLGLADTTGALDEANLDLDRGAYANRVLSRLIILPTVDPTSVIKGKRLSISDRLGGRRYIKKNKKKRRLETDD